MKFWRLLWTLFSLCLHQLIRLLVAHHLFLCSVSPKENSEKIVTLSQLIIGASYLSLSVLGAALKDTEFSISFQQLFCVLKGHETFSCYALPLFMRAQVLTAAPTGYGSLHSAELSDYHIHRPWLGTLCLSPELPTSRKNESVDWLRQWNEVKVKPDGFQEESCRECLSYR